MHNPFMPGQTCRLRPAIHQLSFGQNRENNTILLWLIMIIVYGIYVAIKINKVKK